MKQEITPKEYLTRREVAEKLRVSYPTLKRWRDKNLISCYKIGFIVRYKLSEIEQLLETSHISNSKIKRNEN
jgi:excisionase family DNA binding protein